MYIILHRYKQSVVKISLIKVQPKIWNNSNLPSSNVQVSLLNLLHMYLCSYASFIIVYVSKQSIATAMNNKIHKQSKSENLKPKAQFRFFLFCWQKSPYLTSFQEMKVFDGRKAFWRHSKNSYVCKRKGSETNGSSPFTHTYIWLQEKEKLMQNELCKNYKPLIKTELMMEHSERATHTFLR